MVQFLDDMESHYKGGDAQFNRVFLNDLTECLTMWDDDVMLKSQEAAWHGINDYWLTNGTDGPDSRGKADHWGQCSIYSKNDGNCGHRNWLRHTDKETFGSEKIIMYEPCNYVSNIAYYHSTTRMCSYPDFQSGVEYQKALKRSFASLAVGSAMFHGSFTYVGASFDNKMISIIAYLSHQISTQNVPCVGDCNKHILKEMSLTKRNYTAIEFNDQIT